MTFRFVSLFAAAYSHGEAAAADALLYGIFGPFRYFFYRGVAAIYTFQFPLFYFYFWFPSVFIDALISWPRLKE